MKNRDTERKKRMRKIIETVNNIVYVMKYDIKDTLEVCFLEQGKSRFGVMLYRSSIYSIERYSTN